jgi:hypothetical protein
MSSIRSLHASRMAALVERYLERSASTTTASPKR